MATRQGCGHPSHGLGKGQVKGQIAPGDLGLGGEGGLRMTHGCILTFEVLLIHGRALQ